MRHLIAILLILIAFSALAVTGTELMAAGRAAYDRGDFDQAIDYFERAVALEPNNSEAHYYLGLAQVDQNKYNDAIESFNRSLRLDPTRQEVRAARATANIRAGRYDAASRNLMVDGLLKRFLDDIDAQ